MNAPARIDEYRLDPATRVWRRSDAAEITYTDGEQFEERLLGQLRAITDLATLSDELAPLVVDWPTEAHLGAARANLLRPLRFAAPMRVLEVGAGCGAITRHLGETGASVDALEGAPARAACAAERCRDLPNVRVLCDEFTRYRGSSTHDVVTLIGVLEYARLFVAGDDPVQRLLAHARTALRSSGTLVLAIENQLGLKYFNGCREDHLGAAYAGISDLYGAATPVTFGRAELARRLADAGFARIDWYLPFPDYKLPSTIIAERALAHPLFASGDLLFGEYARDYGGDPLRNFDESAVWPVLARNGLLGDMANSFLVVASVGADHPLDPDGAWLAQRYATSRTRNFLTNTAFIAESGRIRVEKSRLLPPAPEVPGPGRMDIALRVGSEPYVRGRSFARRFADAVARGLDAGGIAAELTPWIGFLVDRARPASDAIPATPWSQLTLPGEFVDCTPFNLIVTESGDLAAIDLELAVAGRVPLPWVALRGVVHTATRCFGHRYLNGRTCRELVDDLMPRLGFGDIGDWSPYCALEDALVRTVLRPWPGRRAEGMFAERLGLPASIVRSSAEERIVAGERASAGERELHDLRAAREQELASLAERHAQALARATAADAELGATRAALAAREQHAARIEAELVERTARADDLVRRLGEAQERAGLEEGRAATLDRRLAEAATELRDLSRRVADAQERAGFEGGRAATLERALAERNSRSLRRKTFRALRAAYGKLPLAEGAKVRAKGWFYRIFGALFADQQNYQIWKALELAGAGGSAPVRVFDGARPQATAGGETTRTAPAVTPAGVVSVVVPAYGNAAMTRRCIESALRASDGKLREIIVVDDASPEPLAPALADLEGVVVVRNEANLGFVGACNRGGQRAQGSLILFLNNDAETKPGSIAAMVETFARRPDVGVVGCKLLFPDGRLQEAGCSIARDGSAQMIGLWDDPARPKYNFERDVAYCSGACFLIDRALFAELGGFDPMFAPAYCEDSDLCFRVREAGRRVVYQPRAEVVHALSASMQDSTIDKRAAIEANQRKFLERWSGTLAREDRVRAIALYLPQYHPIPENDRWWGEGFTEWTNVRRARPSFEGHVQPAVPTGLGYYDLRDPRARDEQARLARDAGLAGFCYYYYWFGGTRLLDAPLDAVLASGEPDFPFCICWANENWTRRWDGLDSEILIAQRHSADDDVAFFESIRAALADRRYILVDGKPLLLVYRPALLPDPAATARRWRECATRAGLPGLYLVALQSFFHVDARGPDAFEFDAAAEFPPHSFAVESGEQPGGIGGVPFEGKAYDYPKTAAKFLARELPPYKVFRGVMPRWDNTPRRGTHANVFVGADPQAYRDWLEGAVRYTREMYVGDERLVFVNAWNEWGEGNYLEPDARYGRAFLDATRSVLVR